MDDLSPAPLLVPTAMAAGGAAIARDADGRVVFVEGALPGERVRVAVTDSRRDFARAVTVEIVVASPDRVAPPCVARAAGCGGCPWQHVAPTAQRRLKAEIVADALRRIGRLPGAPEPSVRVPVERATRTTARLAVGPDDRAGQRRRAGHEAVATDACLAAHPLLEELVTAGRYGGATEVVLRVGVASGERLVVARPAAGGVRVPGDVIVVDEGSADGARIYEQVAGRRLRVSGTSFFQAGPVAAEALVAAVDDAVGDALGPGGHLLDAYAGVGLFASTIGSRHRAGRVTLVESHRAAVDDARANLADLDATVVRGEVGRWRPSPVDPPVDVAVADPARSGLGRPGVGALVAAEAPRLVLVSCDPASLGRDVRLLADAGYRLVSVDLVDAFPDTFHIEAVSRFDRA